MSSYPDSAPWSSKEPHVGNVRHSMRTNPLIMKAGIGKIKKCTFAHKDKDRVFGAPHHQDPEGARELVGFWKENKPDDARATGPDIRAMNKLATISGLTTAEGQQAFRASHLVTLKNGMAVHKPPPPLPSDADPWHTYGSAPDYRSMEQIRVTGRDTPTMHDLVHGAYQWDWVAAAMQREAKLNASHPQLKTALRSSTQASRGHEAAARKALGREQQLPSTLDAFKISKFKRVPARTDTHRQQPAAAAC